jgi:hypothetical protein
MHENENNKNFLFFSAYFPSIQKREFHKTLFISWENENVMSE